MYDLSYLMFVQNFKILGKAVREKSLKKIFHIHYIGLRDRKIKNRKKGKKNTSSPWFCLHLVVLIVYTKFEDCTLDAKLIRRKNCWKERKMDR